MSSHTTCQHTHEQPSRTDGKMSTQRMSPKGQIEMAKQPEMVLRFDATVPMHEVNE